VHVALRRRQIRVSGQFLDGPRRGATHRQVRTERVSQDIDAYTPLQRPKGFEDKAFFAETDEAAFQKQSAMTS
jgi:hypothetical protein